MKLSTQETAHRFFLEIREIKYYREGVILIWGLDFYLVMLTFPFCTYIYIYDIRLQIEIFFLLKTLYLASKRTYQFVRFRCQNVLKREEKQQGQHDDPAHDGDF